MKYVKAILLTLAIASIVQAAPGGHGHSSHPKPHKEPKPPASHPKP